MVTVTFRRDSRNRLSSVLSEGHAGLAEHGRDIACAAVSAILQAALLGLTDVAKIKVESKRSPALLTMSWSDADRDRPDVHAIVATAERSIESIARDYPNNVRFQRSSEAS